MNRWAVAAPSTPPSSNSTVYCVNCAPIAEPACMIAVALFMPGRGARTKVSGASKRWSRRRTVLVSPSSCILLSRRLHKLAAILNGHATIRKDRFTSANRPFHHTPKGSSEIGAHPMTLVQIICLQNERGSKIHQGQVGARTDGQPPATGEAESLCRRFRRQRSNLFQRHASAIM